MRAVVSSYPLNSCENVGRLVLRMFYKADFGRDIKNDEQNVKTQQKGRGLGGQKINFFSLSGHKNLSLK